jgi:creatinine amidohydrolase
MAFAALEEGAAMQLQLSTWPEVEAYLSRSRGIIVPIGSTEQHGPTGVIGTDAICAEVIARATGRQADALVGPTIPVGMAVHHMAFPGTITLQPSTLIRVVQDYVLSLARHGFERFLFVNGHGGNIATVNAAFYEIHAEAAKLGLPQANRLRCRLTNWWSGDRVRALITERFGERDGSHAAASEISVTQHVDPAAIKRGRLDPPLAPSGRFDGPEDFRRRFPDGRIGSDPSLAAPEHGRDLVEAAVADLTAAYRAFADAP